MSGLARMRNVGAFIKKDIGINPVDDDGAAAINGVAVNRVGFESAVLVVQAGAASGAPTTQTVDGKLQHRADSNDTWTDITDAAITQITADNQIASVDVDLSGVKAEFRAVVTVGFTGGTSPTFPVSASIMLGGAVEVPV